MSVWIDNRHALDLLQRTKVSEWKAFDADRNGPRAATHLANIIEAEDRIVEITGLIKSGH